MFTIIAGVIGLGIAVALLIVGANYLGSAYSTSTAKAQATSLANLGQQVQGARQLAIVELGAAPATVSALAPAYLSAVPTFSFGTVTDAITAGVMEVTGVSAALCAQVPVIGGGASVADAAALNASTSRFACTSGATPTFLYKVN